MQLLGSIHVYLSVINTNMKIHQKRLIKSAIKMFHLILLMLMIG